jgi:two-component system chemotaxis sensor kinase CheA
MVEHDRARDEFFSEAQEIVDSLGRHALALDATARAGRIDAETLNEIFRGVHTLKGLSGLFGAALMAGLSHELEDVLDDLRLGRMEPTPAVLDLVFRAVDMYGVVLAAERVGVAAPEAEVEALLVALGSVAEKDGRPGASPVAQYELDPGLLGVLTEYEEHRLRSTIQAGLSLFKLHVSFPLSTIDTALDELKDKVRPIGEIITYLPTGEGGDAERIDLDILVASGESEESLARVVAGTNARVEEVRRREGPKAAAPRVPFFEPEPQTRIARDASVSPTPLPPPPGRSGPPVALAQGGDASREMTLRSVTRTVRVDIRKLDHLMNVVGELAIVRTSLGAVGDRLRQRPELRELSAEMQRLHRLLHRHLEQLQNGILEVRMVPLGQAFDKLARVVRQLSREMDKDINFVVTGAETEIDKLIVEELSDPLMHMIRNAIDHGIEARDERMRAGKPPVGTIALNAYQKGNQVLIEVEDDGRGIDPERVVGSAVARGILTPEEAAELAPREILRLVFRHGFSTRDGATTVSGRGVGMDVVRNNIAKLGGIVDLSSEVGIGTKVTVTLPITLAIISVLMVEVAGLTYAIPLTSIEEAIVLEEPLVRTFDGREVMTQRGTTLPLCRLARLFGLRDEGAVPAQGRPRSFVVISQVGNRRIGFVVDRLFGQQDIVIKALGKSLSDVRGFAGAAELGDQRIALVLDVGALLEDAYAQGTPEPRLGRAG